MEVEEPKKVIYHEYKNKASDKKELVADLNSEPNNLPA